MSPWDERYTREGWAFGTEPNDFLKEEAHRIPWGGRVLCLGEGEGRNAVYLASRGYLVVARELEREIHEGWMHTGRGAVVQVVGVRP